MLGDTGTYVKILGKPRIPRMEVNDILDKYIGELLVPW